MGFEKRSKRRTTVVQNGGSPSETVIWAVAETTGVDPLELDSLHEIVDPDALDSLIQRDAASAVMFEYHGCSVTVQGDGEVVVREMSPEL